MERDEIEPIKFVVEEHFNSHAHVERDVVVDMIFTDPPYNFNSHAHVERDKVQS